MKKKILIVDDEKDILQMLAYNLEKEGYEVATAQSGKEALAMDMQRIDLVLLDVMMPGMDGWEVCRQWKRAPDTTAIPIIFLTAKGAEMDEVIGLELGAEDYIIKPVSIQKLLARIRVALRKQQAPITHRESSAITVGALTIYPESYKISIDGKELELPRKEFETLLYLVEHRDKVVRRESLLKSIWGEDVLVVDRTIDVHIRKIREKLGGYSHYIETVKGVGYRFTVAA